MQKKVLLTAALAGLIFLTSCTPATMGAITTKPFEPNARYEMVLSGAKGECSQVKIMGVSLTDDPDPFSAVSLSLMDNGGDVIMNPSIKESNSAFGIGGYELFSIKRYTVRGDIYRVVK